jgi:hypothetical protein
MTILHRLLPSQDTDALLGDIAEEYAGGRSALWYGLQILAAIVIGSGKAVRANKGVALGAIAAGFGFQMAFGNGLLLARIAARHAGHPTTWLVDELLQVSSDMLLGWSLVRLYRSHGITMLFAFRAAMLAFLLIIFLWYASLAAVRADVAMLVWQASQFRSPLVHLVVESIVMFAGGYLATRRRETV